MEHSVKDEDFYSLLTLFQTTSIWTWPNSKQLQMTNFTKIMIAVLVKVENIVRKGENAGHQHFLLFPQFVLKLLYRDMESQDCMVKG